MKFLPMWLCLLSVAASQVRQDSTPCECKRREVGESGSRKDWAGYDKGIQWHLRLDEARKMAAEQGKLVFYYLVAGDLDKQGC